MIMIRELNTNDRRDLDEMQFALQKYFSEIDQTRESLPYQNLNDAHQYIKKILEDVKNMYGKIFVAEKDNRIVGFIQGVIIEHKKGDDEIYDLTHAPSKEGWIGLLFVKPEHRGTGISQKLLNKIKSYFESAKCTSIRLLVLSDNSHAIEVYRKNGFIPHDLEMVLKLS